VSAPLQRATCNARACLTCGGRAAPSQDDDEEDDDEEIKVEFNFYDPIPSDWWTIKEQLRNFVPDEAHTLDREGLAKTVAEQVVVGTTVKTDGEELLPDRQPTGTGRTETSRRSCRGTTFWLHHGPERSRALRTQRVRSSSSSSSPALVTSLLRRTLMQDKPWMVRIRQFLLDSAPPNVKPVLETLFADAKKQLGLVVQVRAADAGVRSHPLRMRACTHCAHRSG
jgi:hypothetical protein